MSRAFENVIKDFKTSFLSQSDIEVFRREYTAAVCAAFDQKRAESRGNGELWNRAKSEVRVIQARNVNGRNNWQFEVVLTKYKSYDGVLVTPVVMSKEHSYVQRTPGKTEMSRPYTIPEADQHGGNIAIPTHNARGRASRHRQGLKHVPLGGKGGVLVRFTGGTVNNGTRSERRPNGKWRKGTRSRPAFEVVFVLRRSNKVNRDPWKKLIDWDSAKKRSYAEVWQKKGW